MDSGAERLERTQHGLCPGGVAWGVDPHQDCGVVQTHGPDQGKSTQSAPSIDMPGYIIAEPVRNGRRAELLPTVCDCLVALFITGGVRTA